MLRCVYWHCLKNRWKAKNKKFTNVKSYFISYVKINTTIHRTSHSRDHEFGLFWLLLADFKPKMPKFSHFCWFEEYTIYETLIGNWVLRFKWGINQLHRTSHSRDLEFGLFGVVLRLRCLIEPFPLVRRVYIIWNTNRKVDFLIKMRGLSLLYD